jgi:hypothetical protein
VEATLRDLWARDATRTDLGLDVHLGIAARAFGKGLLIQLKIYFGTHFVDSMDIYFIKMPMELYSLSLGRQLL